MCCSFCMERITEGRQRVIEGVLADMRTSLVQEIESHLKEAGLNRTQLANQLGVTKGYVSQLLNGKASQSIDQLVSIVISLGKLPQLSIIDSPVKNYHPPQPAASLVQEKEGDYGTPPFLRGLKLDHLQNLPVVQETLKLKRQIDALRPISESRVSQLLQKFRYAWNFNSNAIEGNQLTFGETLMLIRQGLTAKGKPLKDHLDVEGHEKAVDVILALVKEGRPLTQNNVRQLHATLLVKSYRQASLNEDNKYVFRTINVGAYKTKPNHVLTVGGNIHHYADPAEVPARVGDLLDWYGREEKREQLSPLLTATIFHHEFVAIHPFDDGNGRMGRILMNYTLLKKGYPPIVIPQKERQTYYRALQMGDQGDFQPLVEFLGKHLLISLKVQHSGASGERIYPYQWDES
jgi:Fic family protein/predicted XRE-type DNA-binding protein